LRRVTGSTSKTDRWKALCLSSLQRQSASHRLLLLDEVLDSLPRPLRAGFAADVRAAARAAGFAVVSSTHCLKGDVTWMAEAADEVWVLERGRLRRVLQLAQASGLDALREYAALRCRLGSVNP